MRKYLSLTRVLLKNSAGMMSDGKTKRSRVLALYILLAICFIPTLYLFYKMFDALFPLLIPLHLEAMALLSGFFIVSIVIFVFSIFLIPSIFYFSKDSNILLSLPLRPETILAGKFTVTLLYEYVFTLAVSIPMLIAYIQHLQPSFFFYPLLVIVLLLLPIYPLVLSSIITMLIMRFVPFFKNRDRFNLIGGLLAIILAFAFSFYMNSPMMEQGDPTQLLTSILADPDSVIIQMGTWLFPHVAFGADALAEENIIYLLIFIGITGAAAVLFLLLGKFFYFKGAIGFSETTSSRKRFSEQELAKKNRRRSKVWTYSLKEMNVLLRTPVYFLNCISISLIMPILFVFLYITYTSTLELSFLEHMDLSFLFPYIPAAGIALGFFFSNMNMISASAISREGSNLIFMKYIPMPLGKQLQAKVNPGIFMGVISALLTLIPLYILFPFLPMHWILLLFLCMLPSIVLGNYLGILIDLAHPKLVWEQEAAAVKQNLATFIVFIAGILLIVPIGFLFYYIPESLLLPCEAGVLIVFILLCVILYRKLDAIAVHFFKNL